MAGQTNFLASFFAGDVNSRDGIRVSIKNLGGGGNTHADLVVGSGAGGSSVTAYLGQNITSSGLHQSISVSTSATLPVST